MTDDPTFYRQMATLIRWALRTAQPPAAPRPYATFDSFTVLQSAATRYVEILERLAAMEPDPCTRLAEMRRVSADAHDVYRGLAMIRELLHVIGEDANDR